MSNQIYQLKISLKGLIPPIWRSFQISGQVSLAGLHQVIQVVMGWKNQHPYRFVIAGVAYGDPAHDDWPGIKTAGHTVLRDVSGLGNRFIYVYDFVDDWQHVLRVERIVAPEPGQSYPTCVAGQRACPPENCGGIWPYSDLLAFHQDPQHEDHAAALEFLGLDFDPEIFSVIRQNEMLSKLTIRMHT